MLVIKLESKEKFKACREKYKNTSGACWKMYMWNFFRTKTCYIPSEDCFISLEKAIELNMVIEN